MLRMRRPAPVGKRSQSIGFPSSREALMLRPRRVENAAGRAAPVAAVGSTGAAIVALACNFGLAVATLAAAGWTGSSALLAEAIHTLVDTSSQALLLLGLGRAARAADARHPFGYGREIYFWSFIVAVLLFAMGAGVAMFEGIDRLTHPRELKEAHVAYLVLSIALLLQGVVLAKALGAVGPARGEAGALAALRAAKDPTLFTVVLETMASLVGIAVALAGLVAANEAGIAPADGMASIAIGLVMAAVAAFMAVEIKGLIVGEATHPSVLDGLRVLVGAETGDDRPIRRIHEIRTMHLGPDDVLVVASCDFHAAETAAGVAATGVRIEHAIRARYPQVKRVYIEVQPGEPPSVPPPPPAAAEATPADLAPTTPLSRKARKKGRH